MKITGPNVKQGLDKAIDWLEKSRYQVTGSLEAGSICDGFEQSARRVPRNICADPAVEAKRAVSKSIKIGLVAFGQSTINCLNEADATYVHEFASALKVLADEYLGLELSIVETRSEAECGLQISMMSGNSASQICVQAKRNLLVKNSAQIQILFVDETGVVRKAHNEDFSRMTKLKLKET